MQIGSVWDHDAASFEHQATVAGTYTVVVSDQSINTGDYALYFALSPGAFTVPSGDQGGSLTNGAIHPGKISIADLDLWEFEATNGAVIDIEVEDENATGFFPWARLYDPNGNRVKSVWNHNLVVISHTATVAGRYMLVVADNSSQVGDYLLRYNSTGDIPIGGEPELATVPIPAVYLFVFGLVLAVAGAWSLRKH